MSTFMQIAIGVVAVLVITIALVLAGVDSWLAFVIAVAVGGLSIGWLSRRAEQR